MTCTTACYKLRNPLHDVTYLTECNAVLPQYSIPDLSYASGPNRGRTDLAELLETPLVSD